MSPDTFSCLADAQKIEPDLATQIIDHFKEWLGGNHPQDGAGIDPTVSVGNAIKAFGAVAADQRPRGKDVLDFLGQALSKEYRSRGYAAQALAATNIPEAAQILANHYLAQKTLQAQLVRMGDLAVPKLEVIAEGGHISAIQHLGDIGTPLASKALIPLLKNKRKDVALHAAVQLASLLQKTGIEEELATYSAAELQKSSQTWQEIWDPFDVVQNSTISTIAEQITDQLDKGLQTQQLAQIDLPDLDPRIVLPIIIFSGQIFQKISENWIDTAQILIENTGQETQLETKSPQLIKEALEQQPQRPKWEVLLKTLPLRMQLDVLYRLSVNRPPTRNDWQNLYTTVTYDLRTSWHYRLVVPIVFSLSVIALFGAFSNLLCPSEPLISKVSTVYAFFIVSIVWLVLWRGTEEPFEPNLFMSLGIQGPTSFFREYGRLLRNQIVWNGAQAIFDTITNTKIIRFAVAFAVAVIVAFTFAFAFADDYALIAAFAAAFTDAFATAFTDAVIVAVAVAFAGVVAFLIAFAGVVAGVVAGIGIGAWVEQIAKPGFSRYLAILAAPFFLGSPVVVWFSTLFLHRVAGFSWPIVGLIWLGIVSICTLLLRHGRKQERLAQNPLKGILPDYNTATQ